LNKRKGTRRTSGFRRRERGYPPSSTRPKEVIFFSASRGTKNGNAGYAGEGGRRASCQIGGRGKGEKECGGVLGEHLLWDKKTTTRIIERESEGKKKQTKKKLCLEKEEKRGTRPSFDASFGKEEKREARLRRISPPDYESPETE